MLLFADPDVVEVRVGQILGCDIGIGKICGRNCGAIKHLAVIIIISVAPAVRIFKYYFGDIGSVISAEEIEGGNSGYGVGDKYLRLACYPGDNLRFVLSIDDVINGLVHRVIL